LVQKTQALIKGSTLSFYAKVVQHESLKHAQCCLILGDIGNKPFCQKIVEQTIQAFGQLDILVNHAAKPYSLAMQYFMVLRLPQKLDYKPWRCSGIFIPMALKRKSKQLIRTCLLRISMAFTTPTTSY
jgi:hypothetical protein